MLQNAPETIHYEAISSSTSQGGGAGIRLLMESLAQPYNYSVNISANVGISGDIPTGEDDLGLNFILVVLTIIPVIGFIGNLMVIIAVQSRKELKKSKTNIILSSLAIADMLVSILVMPLTISQMIHRRWQHGHVACGIYIFLDVMFCTSSILHMCVISVDRYMCVSAPMKFNRYSTAKYTGCKIFVVWFAAALVGLPVLVYAQRDASFAYIGLLCAINNTAFQIYGSIAAFFFPLSLMIVSYYYTTKKLRRSDDPATAGRLRRAPGVNHKGLRREKDVLHSSFSNGTNFNNYVLNGTWKKYSRELELSSTTSDTNNNVIAHQCDMHMPAHSKYTTEQRKQIVGKKLSYEYINSALPSNGMPQGEQQKLLARVSEVRRSSSYIRREVCVEQRIKPKLTFLKKTKSTIAMATTRRKGSATRQVDKEKKATQVLRIVFGAFVLCWAPFFIMNVVTAICAIKNYSCNISPVVMDIVLWLGYFESLVNPIIYTIINKNFQKAFKIQRKPRQRQRTASMASGVSKLNPNLLIATVAIGTRNNYVTKTNGVREEKLSISGCNSAV